MKLSLGYLKDLIAFISSLLFFTLYFSKKIEIKKEYVIFFYILVIIFDGTFTFFPTLHNYIIYQSS
jgi:hypothetical protein